MRIFLDKFCKFYFHRCLMTVIIICLNFLYTDNDIVSYHDQLLLINSLCFQTFFAMVNW